VDVVGGILHSVPLHTSCVLLLWRIKNWLNTGFWPNQFIGSDSYSGELSLEPE
jgi:hypothetical protein